jgi:chromosome segregation ATPase
MRILLLKVLVILSIVISYAEATNTVKKIKSSKETLNQSVVKQKQVSEQLDKIAKDIEQAQIDNIELNKKLSLLSDEYQETETSYRKSKKTLEQFDNNLHQINKDIEEKKEKYINLLSQQFSVIHAMTQSHEATREAIIKQEMYKLYKIQNAQELKYLKEQISGWKKQREAIIKDRIAVKKKINIISKQRDRYKKRRKEKASIISKLESSEDIYRTKLQQTLDKQNALRSTLADLNIIHKKEVAEEKRRIAKQKAEILAEKRRKRAERRKRKLARDKARKAGKKVVYNTKRKKRKKKRTVGLKISLRDFAITFCMIIYLFTGTHF